MDTIDTIAARLYDIDPSILRTRNRAERVAYARFIAISLRHADGLDILALSRLYLLDVESIRYALRKTVELEKFNTPFRKLYHEAQRMYASGCVPYDSKLIRQGVEVRTRIDSSGMSRTGLVSGIDDDFFTVESFDDPSYLSVHDIKTGHISTQFESSLDIVAISI